MSETALRSALSITTRTGGFTPRSPASPRPRLPSHTALQIPRLPHRHPPRHVPSFPSAPPPLTRRVVGAKLTEPKHRNGPLPSAGPPRRPQSAAQTRHGRETNTRWPGTAAPDTPTPDPPPRPPLTRHRCPRAPTGPAAPSDLEVTLLFKSETERCHVFGEAQPQHGGWKPRGTVATGGLEFNQQTATRGGGSGWRCGGPDAQCSVPQPPAGDRLQGRGTGSLGEPLTHLPSPLGWPLLASLQLHVAL